MWITYLNDEMWSLNGTVAPTLRFAIPGLLIGPSCWFEQPPSLYDKIRHCSGIVVSQTDM